MEPTIVLGLYRFAGLLYREQGLSKEELARRAGESGDRKLSDELNLRRVGDRAYLDAATRRYHLTPEGREWFESGKPDR